MAKKNCNEHVVCCRTAELGIDLSAKSSPFNNSQRLIIRESLRSENFDSNVIKMYVRPEIKAATMNEFYYALKNNMHFSNFEILYKFVNMPAQVISRIRKLLEDDLVNQKILDDIFFDGEGYVFYCRHNRANKYDLKDSAYSCLSYRKSGISKMLDVIRLIMNESILRRLFSTYIEMNSQETVQNMLYLCSGLTENEIVDVLERKISLETIKQYLAFNRSRKSWRGLVNFLNLHDRSENYVRAYLDGMTDNISKGDLLMFFELESNCLTDEIFFKHNLSIDNLRKLENHCFKKSDNRFSLSSCFNSYDCERDEDGKIAVIAKSIDHWLKAGFPVELIRDYIDVCDDNNLTAKIMNIGLGNNVSPNDASIIARDRTLYLQMRKVSQLLAQGFSIQDIKSDTKIDGRLKSILNS